MNRNEYKEDQRWIKTDERRDAGAKRKTKGVAVRRLFMPRGKGTKFAKIRNIYNMKSRITFGLFLEVCVINYKEDQHFWMWILMEVQCV